MKYLAEVIVQTKSISKVESAFFVMEGKDIYSMVDALAMKVKENIKNFNSNSIHGLKIVLRKG